MSKDQLTKVWSAVAAILLFYSLNTYISTQGGAPLFGVPLLSSQREVGALYALILCPPMLLIVALLGELYRRRHGADSKWEGVPPAFIGELDCRKAESRVYLAAVVLLAYMVPMLTFVHFGQIVSEASVCAKDVKGVAPKIAPKSIWTQPESGFWCCDAYRLAGMEADKSGERDAKGDRVVTCTGGASFTPLVAPLLLSLSWGLAFAAAAYHLARLIGVGKRLRTHSAGG